MIVQHWSRLMPGLFTLAHRLCLSAPLLMGLTLTANANEDAVVTQEALKAAVAAHAPAKTAFIKDQPILAWTLSSDRVEDLPEAIRDALGDVDQTGYAPEYLARNIGSVIALQMEDDGPDFYVIGKSTFESDYATVPVEEVAEKNARLVERLDMLPEVKALFEARDPSMTAVRKTTEVEMIRMSDIGLSTDREITIASLWGEQSKPAGQDGFLVHTEERDQYYLVNEGDDGLPLSYVPSE